MATDVLDSRTAAVYAGVEREHARKGYPENFPILPEMPVGRYTDPRFYDLEMRHFWPSTWLHVIFRSGEICGFGRRSLLRTRTQRLTLRSERRR